MRPRGGVPGRASSRSAAFAIALLTAIQAIAAEPAPVISGWAEARYRGGNSTIPSYRNAAFSQNVENGEITVRVDIRADRWTRAPFALDPSWRNPGDPIESFAREVVDGSRTRAEAVNRVLHAVAARVEYQVAGGVPSDAAAVLLVGRGHCVGRSNLAVAALKTVGIPARTVHGTLFDRTDGVARAHRWIEVFYPDCGWVFSDPTESINYVGPRHLVLTLPPEPDPDYDPAFANWQAPKLVSIRDQLMTLDLHPRRASRLAERRVSPTQFAASVVGRVVPDAAGDVVLSGGGLRRRLKLRPGEPFSFPGLQAGSYLLKGTFSDVQVSRRVTLFSGELRALEMVLP